MPRKPRPLDRDSGVVRDPYQLGMPNPVGGEPKNFSPLYCAIVVNDDKLVDLLLSGGARVDRPILSFTGRQMTPIHFAAYRGTMQVVKALIGHGANVNAKTPDGLTPFDYAVMQNRIEVSKFLEKHGKGN